MVLLVEALPITCGPTAEATKLPATVTPPLFAVSITVAPLLPTPIVILSVVPTPEVETKARAEPAVVPPKILAAVRPVVNVGDVPKTATPVPVSSLSTPASCAEVVDANWLRAVPVTPHVVQVK